MKILITGAKGFVGKNLTAHLRDEGYINIYEYDLENNEEDLRSYCMDCDFVYHLAGVNRSVSERDFLTGNCELTNRLIEYLKVNDNVCPIVYSSSIQAELDNPYGRSKRAAEELLFSYGSEEGTNVYVYRFENLYGKWCRPDYNSVVATFCNNIAAGRPIQIHAPDQELEFIYIDDAVQDMMKAMKGEIIPDDDGFCYIRKKDRVSLKSLAELIQSFRKSRIDKYIPDMTCDSFSKKLYSTYLSYLPEDNFDYVLDMIHDERGSFTEVFRTADRGQLSVNHIKPGITKGNHWHHSKNEKFLVVHGEGIIRFRNYESDNIIEYPVTSDILKVVDIPAGYTHSIENTGKDDMAVLMWCNESYDRNKPDTIFSEVRKKPSESEV